MFVRTKGFAQSDTHTFTIRTCMSTADPYTLYDGYMIAYYWALHVLWCVPRLPTSNAEWTDHEPRDMWTAWCFSWEISTMLSGSYPTAHLSPLKITIQKGYLVGRQSFLGMQTCSFLPTWVLHDNRDRSHEHRFGSRDMISVANQSAC